MGLFHHRNDNTTTDVLSAASTAIASATTAASSATATLFDGIRCGNYDTTEPLTGSMGYHTLITIIAGACTAAALVLCGVLALTHILKFRWPDEQKQLVRIIWAPAVIAIFSFFGVWFYGAAGYVKPIGEWYECFALVPIFYLFIHYATPNGPVSTHPFNKLPVTAASYSVDLSSLNAQTFISVINILSTIFCLLALLHAHKYLKPCIGPYKPMLKLLCLKLIVGLDIIQSLIFSILANNGEIKPTAKLNLPDLLIGTQDFMLCIECFLIAVLFLFPFSAARYSTRNFEA
ncbi:hypothetical protein NA57DRAFT_61669 [Rhizodiscina lignyota]|uniref:Uncharacterized protein n=1 Tax=Rhizodiscina lignyota TaxID=1504668 RepID=A0A9P4M014_9PEZI|nr:hypothetical protein NA57DRAFT_61669 [Rhizodiscina lignyota]